VLARYDPTGRDHWLAASLVGEAPKAANWHACMSIPLDPWKVLSPLLVRGVADMIRMSFK
jgi:hypothetical protein